jgi:hypothetical protein
MEFLQKKALPMNSAAIIGGVGAAAAADLPKEGSTTVTSFSSGTANSREHRFGRGTRRTRAGRDHQLHGYRPT